MGTAGPLELGAAGRTRSCSVEPEVAHVIHAPRHDARRVEGAGAAGA
eukprot:SAG22_NODE_8903_length_622_cov_1.399618_1_plen_46_part_10